MCLVYPTPFYNIHQCCMFRIALRFRDSAAGIGTRIWVVGSVIPIAARTNIFLFSKMSRTTPGSFQPPIKQVPEFFTGDKAAGA